MIQKLLNLRQRHMFLLKTVVPYCDPPDPDSSIYGTFFFRSWEDDPKAFKSKETLHVLFKNGIVSLRIRIQALPYIRYVFLLMRRSLAWKQSAENDPKAFKSKV